MSGGVKAAWATVGLALAGLLVFGAEVLLAIPGPDDHFRNPSPRPARFGGPGRSQVCLNLTGHPTAVTRCGVLDDVPQSVEFVGGLYREAAALRVALAYERVTTWRRQWPDVDRLPATPPPLVAPKSA